MSAVHMSKREFVILMALMTSIVALSMDSMLPAFSDIQKDFLLSSSNETQLIVAVLFLGYGFGQLFFGPSSDYCGRKPPIYWGIFIFMVGSVLSGVASHFETFLFGRFLQGFGGASPRIISLALIRDKYSGNAMAQVTSLVMTIFILVPAIAPAIGQGLLFLSGWRSIFIVLFFFGLLVGGWFSIRQGETLSKELRPELNLKQLKRSIIKTYSEPTTLICMLISGLVFGIFVGYLGAVKDIFTKIFSVGDAFPIYFGVLALSIGAASFLNSKIVMMLGMRRVIFLGFLCVSVLSNGFSFYLILTHIQVPSLELFMSYMMLNFFFIGCLFGNLNALAMQPLGEIAGIGAALLGFTQSSISVVVGVVLGRYFHEQVLALSLSFGVISFICIVLFWFENKYFAASSLD